MKLILASSGLANEEIITALEEMVGKPRAEINVAIINEAIKGDGFAEILPEILAEKVWVGSSAGSCVLCHKESDEIKETIYKEKRETDKFMDYVPIIFLPHLHGWFKFDREEVLRASELTDLPVYALSDNCALKIVDRESPVILGSDYIIAQQGELL